MRSSFVSALLMLCLLGVPQSASAGNDPDPQIGQPAVGHRLSVTKYDNVGFDSVLQDCGTANKLFILVAKIKRGTPGIFIQPGNSLGRFKTTTGEVMESTGFRSVSKRRIAFMLSSSVPSGATMIDKSARNTLILATNDPRGKVVLRPVITSCVING